MKSSNTAILNDRSKTRLEDLVADARKHGLVLFLGSGINGGLLPQWNELLNSLLVHAMQMASCPVKIAPLILKWCETNFDACAQASVIKTIFGNSYLDEIQDSLYSKKHSTKTSMAKCALSHREISQKTHLLKVVAELGSLSLTKAIATFNFDKLLEDAIDAIGSRRPRIYFGQIADSFGDDEFSPSDIPVYHIHGLISPPTTISPSPEESVILSYEEYFALNADLLSWQTSTCLHFLRNYCTLWIGSSLRDWNMLKLLYGAISGGNRIRSYCIQCSQEVKLPKDYSSRPTKTKEFREFGMTILDKLYENAGVKLIVAGLDYSDIPTTIEDHIIKPLHENRKRRNGNDKQKRQNRY